MFIRLNSYFKEEVFHFPGCNLIYGNSEYLIRIINTSLENKLNEDAI